MLTGKRRCLEKDPTKRLRHIGDVWELLEDEQIAAASAPLTVAARNGSRLVIGLGIAAAVCFLAALISTGLALLLLSRPSGKCTLPDSS